jgi:hypothetical protein
LASADEDSVDAVDWEKLREEDADSSWWFTAATTTTTTTSVSMAEHAVD